MQKVLKKLYCLANQECTLKLCLVDMPDVVMNQILEELDLKTILLLRKGSHEFRNYIDSTKLSLQMTMLYIGVQSHMISFEVFLKSKTSPGTQRFTIEYSKEDTGCMVKCVHRRNIIRKFLKFEDFLATSLVDFNILMGLQKSSLTMFQLDLDFYIQKKNNQDRNPKMISIAEKFLDSIENVLKSRKYPVQTEEFCMTVIEQDQVLKVLPYIDSEKLIKITINGKRDFPMDSMEFDQIEKLEQWKAAKELNIWRFDNSTPLEKFSNFSKVDIFLQEVRAEKLIQLKKFFLESSILESFNVKFKILDGEDYLIRSFGPYSSGSDRYGIKEFRWNFKFPNDVLLISLLSSGSISFKRVKAF